MNTLWCSNELTNKLDLCVENTPTFKSNLGAEWGYKWMCIHSTALRPTNICGPKITSTWKLNARINVSHTSSKHGQEHRQLVSQSGDYVNRLLRVVLSCQYYKHSLVPLRFLLIDSNGDIYACVNRVIWKVTWNCDSVFMKCPRYDFSQELQKIDISKLSKGIWSLIKNCVTRYTFMGENCQWITSNDCQSRLWPNLTV